MGLQFGASCLPLILVVTVATCQRITEISADGRSCIVRFNETQTVLVNISRIIIEQTPVQSVFGRPELRNRTRIVFTTERVLTTSQVTRCCDNFVNISGTCTLVDRAPPPQETPNTTVVIVVAVVLLFVAIGLGVIVTVLMIRKKRDRKKSDTRKMQDFFPSRVSLEQSPDYMDFANNGQDPPPGTDGYYSSLEGIQGSSGHPYQSLASTRAVTGPGSRTGKVEEKHRGAEPSGPGDRRKGTVTPPQIYEKLDPGSRGRDLYSGLVDLDRTSVLRDSSGYLLPDAAAADQGRAPVSISLFKGGNSSPRESREASGPHGYLVMADDIRASSISADYSYIDPREKNWGPAANKQGGHIDTDNRRDSYNDASSKEGAHSDAGKKGSSGAAVGRQETYNDALSKKDPHKSAAAARQATYNDAASKKGILKE